eukprot:964188-Prymnesium_polylepis.1
MAVAQQLGIKCAAAAVDKGLASFVLPKEVGVWMEQARAAAAGRKEGERPKVGDTMLVLPAARGRNAECIGQRGTLEYLPLHLIDDNQPLRV